MSVGMTKKYVKAEACMDTGADFTVCDTAFVLSHFGAEALTEKFLYYPERLPSLRSATGHNLKTIGKLMITLRMGTYHLRMGVIVY